jgi:fermentation-respiration switch protein FrsA (DUF1100 family)
MTCKTTAKGRSFRSHIASALGVASVLGLPSRAGADPLRLRGDALAETQETSSPTGPVVLQGEDSMRPWTGVEGLVWAGWAGTPTATGDVLTLVVHLREPHGYAEARVGRFILATGAVHPVQIDGARVIARAPWGSVVETFGGIPVVSRFGARDYDWLVGGRVAETVATAATLGISYVQRREDGEIANEEVGADLAVAPARWVDLAAFGAYDLTSPGLAEARAAAAARWRDWRFELFGSQLSPGRLLPATSLFSVLGDMPSQTIGGTVRWRAAPRLDLLASGAGQDVAAGIRLPSTAGARAGPLASRTGIRKMLAAQPGTAKRFFCEMRARRALADTKSRIHRAPCASAGRRPRFAYPLMVAERKRGRFASIAFSILLVIGLTLIATRSVARAYLFPASGGNEETTADDVLVDRTFARDGMPVRALELSSPSATRTIVHFHNNRETAEGLLDLGRALRARGFNVVLAEYRGYGASPGRDPSEEGLYEDAEAILRLLATRGIGSDRIVLWGTSLGTGVAAEMARRGRGSRLVLVSPYTSIPDLVTSVVPLLPAGILVPDHFDTLSKARSIRVPTLIVHGDADEIVPFRMGEELAHVIPLASLLRVTGGHHGDLLSRERGRVLSAIVAFGS